MKSSKPSRVMNSSAKVRPLRLARLQSQDLLRRRVERLDPPAQPDDQHAVAEVVEHLAMDVRPGHRPTCSTLMPHRSPVLPGVRSRLTGASRQPATASNSRFRAATRLRTPQLRPSRAVPLTRKRLAPPRSERAAGRACAGLAQPPGPPWCPRGSGRPPMRRRAAALHGENNRLLERLRYRASAGGILRRELPASKRPSGSMRPELTEDGGIPRHAPARSSSANPEIAADPTTGTDRGEQGGAISLMLAGARHHPQPSLPDRTSAPSDLLPATLVHDEG